MRALLAAFRSGHLELDTLVLRGDGGGKAVFRQGGATFTHPDGAHVEIEVTAEGATVLAATATATFSTPPTTRV